MVAVAIPRWRLAELPEQPLRQRLERQIAWPGLTNRVAFLGLSRRQAAIVFLCQAGRAGASAIIFLAVVVVHDAAMVVTKRGATVFTALLSALAMTRSTNLTRFRVLTLALTLTFILALALALTLALTAALALFITFALGHQNLSISRQKVARRLSVQCHRRNRRDQRNGKKSKHGDVSFGEWRIAIKADRSGGKLAPSCILADGHAGPCAIDRSLL